LSWKLPYKNGMPYSVRHITRSLKNFFDEFSIAFLLALKSLRTNFLRTFLSLTGISVGIFTVSSLYTGVDSLKNNLMETLEGLGNNTLFIDRFNYQDMGKMRYLDLRKFKAPDYKEYLYLKRHLSPGLYEAINFHMTFSGIPLTYKGREVQAGVSADTYDVFRIFKYNLKEGRFYNMLEDRKGKPVAVLGADVAEALFPGGNAVGKEIRWAGKKLQVIGVLKKESGTFTVNPSDEKILIPYTLARKILPGNTGYYSSIEVVPKDPRHLDALKEELEILLRRYRKLKPGQKNNFFINNIDFLKDMISQSMRALRIAGWILGGFALLVGAFGIANIMFVSVKERTRDIGIQKAVGANRRVIMMEFLIESVLLSVLGGLVGLLILLIGINIVQKFTPDFEWVLSLKNILYVTMISLIIGILAGLLPAYEASGLHPIDAIRRK